MDARFGFVSAKRHCPGFRVQSRIDKVEFFVAWNACRRGSCSLKVWFLELSALLLNGALAVWKMNYSPACFV